VRQRLTEVLDIDADIASARERDHSELIAVRQIEAQPIAGCTFKRRLRAWAACEANLGRVDGERATEDRPERRVRHHKSLAIAPALQPISAPALVVIKQRQRILPAPVEIVERDAPDKHLAIADWRREWRLQLGGVWGVEWEGHTLRPRYDEIAICAASSSTRGCSVCER